MIQIWPCYSTPSYMHSSETLWPYPHVQGIQELLIHGQWLDQPQAEGRWHHASKNTELEHSPCPPLSGADAGYS